MGNASGGDGSFGVEAHETLAFVRGIFDTVREALLVLDGDLRVQSANRAFYRSFRVSPRDTEGQLLYELGSRQWDIPSLRALLEEALLDDASFDDFEIEHDFPEIGRKVMLLNARRLRQEGAERILLAIEDVTERRRAEQERHDIETRFTSLVKNVQDHSIFTLDPEGRVTSWNVAAEHILGYTEAEALGRHFEFIFTPEDREDGIPEMELRTAREQGHADDERWHLRKSRERFWALGIVSALYDAEGRLTGFSKILRDMTAWKRAQEAAETSERRLRLALDRAFTVAFEWDIPRNEVWRQHSRLGSAPATSEMQPSTLEEFVAAVHPDDRERFLANLNSTLDHPERGYQAEYRLCEPDGRILWLSEHGYLECDKQGKPQRLIGLIQDVSERKRSEEAILAAKELARQRLSELEDIYRNAPVGLCLLDRDLRFLRINERLAEINGVPAVEHLGKTVREVLPMLADKAEPGLRDVLETGQARLNHELVGETPARPGVQRTWIEHWTPVKGDSGEAIGVSIVVEEITERKQAEAALLESEERLNLATDATELAVFEWDLTSDCVKANDRFRRWYGLDSGDSMTASELIHERVHPSDRAFVEAQLRQAMDSASSGRYNFEYRMVPPAGGGERWLMTRGQVCFEGAGDDRRPVRVLGTNLDVTERKRIERRLRDSDQRKDIFLATLAHELRSPLAPIRTGLELIDAWRGDAAACEEPVRIMERQISHLVRLVDDLLDVSRISRGKIVLRRERLVLADVIDAALDMSRDGLTEGDRLLTVDVPSERLEVEGDRVRLVQAIANLLNNASKFTETNGRIDLRVAPRGEWVEIQVEDDGLGIPGDRLGTVFESFAQVEAGSRGGLGIGLSLARGVVELHGGTVSVHSAGLGCGAAFSIFLPLCQPAPPRPTVGEEVKRAVDPERSRVLVVDDNRDITKSLQLLLTGLGAEVEVACDGHEALRVFGEWAPTHVLMDLGMPGMDGYEAARRLRAQYPDRPFRLIAATGWGQEEDRRRTREAGFDEHLVKPIRAQDLLAALSR